MNENLVASSRRCFPPCPAWCRVLLCRAGHDFLGASMLYRGRLSSWFLLIALAASCSVLQASAVFLESGGQVVVEAETFSF